MNCMNQYMNNNNVFMGQMFNNNNPVNINYMNNINKNMNRNMNNMNMNNMNFNNMNNMNFNNMNINNMNNMNMNNMNYNNNNLTPKDQQRLSRLAQEFKLCNEDNDLIQIGCSFGLKNPSDLSHWIVTMTGPENTPYEGGLFKISITFPPDFPNHGPEFKFLNKIFHLNVDYHPYDFGHICVSSINDWRISGKVKGGDYTVKQALFDIFCLFYNQGVEAAYEGRIKDLYLQNKVEFEKEARNWTKMYAPNN